VKDVPRNPDGTLKPGAVLNPQGIGGCLSGRARWDKRVEHILDKYPTLEALEALVRGPDWKQTHPLDAGIVAQLIGQFSGDDKRLERESFWDRMEGKPKERKELSGPDGGDIGVSIRGEASGAVRSVVSALTSGRADSGDSKAEVDSEGKARSDSPAKP